MMANMLKVSRAAARAARSFTTSAKARAGEFHEPDYVHAPSMYNLPAMKNRKLKFGLAVGGVVVVGTVLPLVAVELQQIRARG